MYDQPTYNFVWCYPGFGRLVLQDTLNITDSPFSDRDTFTFSLFYLGVAVGKSYHRFLTEVVKKLRDELKYEVRWHPGKYDPFGKIEMSEERRISNERWDPLERFGSDQYL